MIDVDAGTMPRSVIDTFASTLALMLALPEQNEAEAFGVELHAQMSISGKGFS